MPAAYPISKEQEQAILDAYKNVSNVSEVCRQVGLPSKPVYRILKRYNVTIVAPWVSRSKFTFAVETEIMERYKNGEGACKLAREYGCEPITIRKIRERHGVKQMPHGGRKFFNDGDKNRMRSFWDEGRSVNFIARALNVSPECARVNLEEIGVNIEPRLPRGANSSRWAGGRHAHSGQYYYANVAPSDPLACMRNRYGYVLEHRLVMARHLGRPLSRSETVHHINGDGKDNRIENLQLRTGLHGKGVVLCCADCGSQHIVPAPLV
jgi:hypothetical protein